MSEEAYADGLMAARRLYAQAWADGTGAPMEAVRFTPDFISQWLVDKGKQVDELGREIGRLETERDDIGKAIDALRRADEQAIADALQFGVEGRDLHDGHRCRLCDQLQGGDRKHRCWEDTPQAEGAHADASE